MAAYAREHAIRLRPHAKMHKCPALALRQLALGAVGMCCQKVSEAEVMVAGGVNDVLISNEVVGGAKLERLARLARRARIGVCVDDCRQRPRTVGGAALRAGALVDVYVEIDIGARRCGVAPGAAGAGAGPGAGRAAGPAPDGPAGLSRRRPTPAHPGRAQRGDRRRGGQASRRSPAT